MRLRLLLLVFAALLAAPMTARAQATDPSFNLVNRSGQIINEIYISGARDQFWGPDLLGSDTLANGAIFPVRLAPSAGCQQDVRVVYANGRNEERRNQNTCALTDMQFGTAAPPAGQQPGPAATPQPGGNPSFNLVNHGRAPIREIYVSAARDTHWGDDRLGTEILPAGRHFEVRLAQGECVNDVRIVWMDGRNEERRRTDTCAVTNLVFQ